MKTLTHPRQGRRQAPPMNPENLTKAIHDAAFLLSDLHAAQNAAAASHPEIAALLAEPRNQTREIKYRPHKIAQALP